MKPNPKDVLEAAKFEQDFSTYGFMPPEQRKKHKIAARYLKQYASILSKLFLKERT